MKARVKDSRKIVVLFFIIFLLTSSLGWSGQSAKIRLFAHRGLRTNHPENSLGAVKTAIELGIHGAEIDLRTTKDGEIILMHDESLERTTTGRGLVRESSYEDIKELKLVMPGRGSTGENVPLLSEVLELVASVPDFELALDLKNVDLTALTKMVEKAGLIDRVWFAIANPEMVAACREIQKVDPKAKLSVNLLGWWKIEGLPAFVKQALGAEALFASEWFFPRYGFNEAHEAGAEVHVFLWGDQDLLERANKAIELGADVISVDKPELLISSGMMFKQIKEKVMQNESGP